ncbi:MarR family transcriptional regulator [Actinomadura sp. 6K520]|uniref:MarR family winged helix-turn-helix transcriptional regulator n=1 Tax=Actinomadura sp. 6K520 TaxID=2530364 RepID=UPI00104599D4|nr:MarR family transcriptional regulator [Actinomadura sp. 6K520]TDE35506.1 MarR family transcriptional regulator [Actinomadura sp. 6K520]
MTKQSGHAADAQPADVQMERDVCRLVHRFAQRLDVHVRHVADNLGITATQVVALRELTEPITARELATRMVCEASNATFVVDRLEDHGLVERRPHPTDRRAKQIVLTPSGEEYRAKALEQLSAHSPLAALDDGQQDSLRALLRTLLA